MEIHLKPLQNLYRRLSALSLNSNEHGGAFIALCGFWCDGIRKQSFSTGSLECKCELSQQQCRASSQKSVLR